MPRQPKTAIIPLDDIASAFHSEVGLRIRAVVDRYESRKNAARAAGKSEDQLAKYMAGTSSPPFETIYRLANGTGVSIEWVATGTGPMLSLDRNSNAVNNNDAMNNPLNKIPARIVPGDDLGENFVLLPRYNVEAAAGGGVVVHSEQVVDFLAFKYDWVRRTLGLNPDRLALITAVGDSMKPTIKEGDLLLLDCDANQVDSNAIYAISINGSLLVKRIQVLMNGDIKIISDNSSYEPETIRARELDDLRVVGRVVWHGGCI